MPYFNPDYSKFGLRETNFTNQNYAADRSAYLAKQTALAAEAAGESVSETKQFKDIERQTLGERAAQDSDATEEMAAYLKHYKANTPKKKPGLLQGLMAKVTKKSK